MLNSEQRGRRRSRATLVRRGGVAGVIGLALSSVAITAAPVGAQSPPAQLTFVNAYNVERFTAVVDEATPEEQEIDMKELRALSPVDIAAGSHAVDIYAGQSTSGAPFTSRSLQASSDESIAFAVHPNVDGTSALTTIFRDDTSLTGAASTRVVVRHTASAGPVQVELSPTPSSADGGTTESFEIANGQQGVIGAVAASEGLLYQLEITPVGASSPLITDTEIQLTPGEVTTIYVAGSPPSAETSSDPESLIETNLQVGALPPPSVNLVNGFTDNQYVMYVDDTQNSSIEGLRRNGMLQGLSEGTVSVDAYLSSSTPGSGSPAASLDITVCDGRSYDLAIHPSASGATLLTLFENDVTAPATERTRFTIRHIGEFGPLDFEFGPSGENPGAAGTSTTFTLSNGEEEVVDDAFINDYLVNAFNPGTTAGPVTQNTDLEGEGNATQIAYVMGTPPGATNPISEYFPGSGEPVIPNAPMPAEAGADCGSTTTDTGGGTTNPTDPSTPAESDYFTSVDPARVLDTRNSTDGPEGFRSADSSLILPMAGVAGVASDATAVVVNIAATETAGPGFVSALPEAPTGPPKSANLTFGMSNATVSSNVTVPLNSDGSLALYTSTGTHLVLDVLGYYSPTDSAIAGGRFVPLKPARLFDTRTSAAPSGILTPGSPITVDALGNAGLPADGVQAVVMNLTATDQVTGGFVAIDDDNPGSVRISSLNYLPSDIAVGNMVIAQVDANGDFSAQASSNVNLIGDVVGYFTDETATPSTAGLFETVSPPERAFDTRLDSKVTPSSPLTADVVGAAGLSASDVLAVSLSVTATEGESPLYIEVTPEGTDELVATVNLLPGQTRTNATYVGVSSAGTVRVEAIGVVDVIGDLTGYFITG